jgi:hypothetical protein
MESRHPGIVRAPHAHMPYLARSAVLPLVAVLVLAAPAASRAWSEAGHEVTGRIADALLTTTARHELRAIMLGERLADSATWMDRHRDALAARNPATRAWHYENRGICTGGSNLASCGAGDCITRKIAEYRAVLASTDAPTARRREAVRYLVHLVGDLHQPLHVADHGDRGGNDVAITPPGREQVTLHGFWDDYLIEQAMSGRLGLLYDRHLRRRFSRELDGWMAGAEEDWAVESFELARTFVYPELDAAACQTPLAGRTFQPPAGGEYITRGADVVARRMAMAGARIAYVLNSALDPE